jgi:hypothetical protein
MNPTRRGFLGGLLSLMGGCAAMRELTWPRAALPEPQEADLGLRYHEWSKPGHARYEGPPPDWGTQPPRYKTYLDAPRIVLPTPSEEEDGHLMTVLHARRSQRSYRDEPISPAELGQLLFAAQGITYPPGELRAAPSAGALYPIELYVLAHRVADLPTGLYHYAVQTHELELVRAGDLRGAISGSWSGTGFLGRGECVLRLIGHLPAHTLEVPRADISLRAARSRPHRPELMPGRHRDGAGRLSGGRLFR